MRAVVQRVTDARVEVASEVAGEISAGLLVLLGVAGDDTGRDADYLAEKTNNLRVFDDREGKMNLSLLETGGAMLVVISSRCLFEFLNPVLEILLIDSHVKDVMAEFPHHPLNLPAQPSKLSVNDVETRALTL